MRLWMIDNYDSFTYNLVQYFGELGARVDVVRNNKATSKQILENSMDGIVVSPGPGHPEQAGISLEVIKEASLKGISVLGVCLGHQAIGMAFGADITRARSLMHGKTSLISHTGEGLFSGLPTQFEATRYHSLAIERSSVPPCLEITAESDDGEVMGIRHRDYPIDGVQFHPESIMTSVGKEILKNFIVSCERGT